MASSRLRSSPANWLLGTPTSQLSTARLPRGLDVLQLVQFHHLDKGRTLPESYKLAIEEVIVVWERARIPTQRIDSCVRKLSKLYEKYLALKKHQNRQRESDRIKEEMFKGDLEELLDVATKDALMEIKNEEDRQFLLKQREDVFSCSMSGGDVKTASKECRKRQREEKEIISKLRYEERENKTVIKTTEKLSSTSSSDENKSQDEYSPSASTSTAAAAPSLPKRRNNIFNSPEVVGALDRINLPDRGAVFVAAAVAQALGHNISEITLSRSSVRRSRRQGREEAAATEEQESLLEGPLLLHWDGKLLPDINRSKARVDRIAVLVTGNGQEKLLGIPKIEEGTGEAQAKACVDAIHKWNIGSQIKGIVFDTTASNTGLDKGACTKIEKALRTELVWIACRHHVMEIMLSNVFSSILGPSSGPEIGLFKRFQKVWPSINKDTYAAATDAMFQNPVLSTLRQEMLNYLPHALATQQPRDDYKEFLHLSLLFLGGGSENELFRAPGPTHHARWMGKGIFALKIFLFQSQFNLTSREARNITELALFVSLVYIRQWNEAPYGIHAPYNDIQLLAILKTYPNQTVASKACTAFCRHLWFLSEHLVALAFFDDRVSMETKEKMVQNLQRPKFPDYPRRVQMKNQVEDLKLEGLVTERTSYFFDVLMEGGRTKSQSFLEKPPRQWMDDPIFIHLRERSSQMKVVNDTAERGISLIQKYNETLTMDEEQKQFLLRLVANHRKKFPTPSKAALMS